MPGTKVFLMTERVRREGALHDIEHVPEGTVTLRGFSPLPMRKSASQQDGSSSLKDSLHSPFRDSVGLWSVRCGRFVEQLELTTSSNQLA